MDELREALAAYEEFYEFDPPENQMTWEPVLADAARRFLALTETGPDYEAAGRELHDSGGVQGNWECGSMGSDPPFPECGCVDAARAIVKAALVDYLTEEETDAPG